MEEKLKLIIENQFAIMWALRNLDKLPSSQTLLDKQIDKTYDEINARNNPH